VEEHRTKTPFHHLRVGSSLEVQQSNELRQASVTQMSENEVSVQLSRPEGTSPFENGEQVRLKYWDKEGIYYCNAEVAQVSGPGNQKIDLSIVTRPVAMQRRRSFRLPHKIDVWLEVVDAIHGSLPPGKVIKSETLDISGTGLSLESNAPLKVMDELKVSFHLSKNKKVDGFATVVSSEKVKKKGKFVNLIGLEFHGLLPEAQTHLMEFLNEINPTQGK
jgi:c-di-GMP-binding flagellar brake protein YcgR